MIREYKTIYEYGEDEQSIQKSRFIAYVKPVKTEEEAINFINSVKEQHKTATHNVPVYVLGQNYEIQRYSDDGEPSGTAGLPILEMIKKEEIKDMAIVVTRYYGGTKLGTGGLVRAYTSTAKLGINKSQVVNKVLHDFVKIRIEYTLLGKMQNEIMNNNYIIKNTEFDDSVNIYVYSKVEETEKLDNIVKNITKGKTKIQIIDTLYLDKLKDEIKF
ncbi:YigZ family protein [Anaeromicrobium sp.]|uniref:YigZ family protein n=1 Tax=Anaeromicrobium sp. TaxID=1929132 RepID=UPI002ED3BC1B